MVSVRNREECEILARAPDSEHNNPAVADAPDDLLESLTRRSVPSSLCVPRGVADETRPTASQLEVLTLVASHLQERGYPPSLREIGALTGRSMSAIIDRVLWLRRKGLLAASGDESRLALTDAGWWWIRIPERAHGLALPDARRAR